MYTIFLGEQQDEVELSRLLQLILGCAVNCEDKQEYIQRIMGLEESVQHMVMQAIQEVHVIKTIIILKRIYYQAFTLLSKTTSKIYNYFNL